MRWPTPLFTILGLAATALACGGSGAGPDPERPDQRAELLSSRDRCPMLLECQPKEIETSGCPDPFFEFRDGTAELAPGAIGLLEALAGEIQSTPRLRSLRIRGHAGSAEAEALAGSRASTVRDWLVEAGVPGQILEISADATGRDGSSYATLEVVDCTGNGVAGDEQVNSGGMLLILF